MLTNRLTQAIEETILLLVESRPEEEGLGERRMRLRVREERGRIEVELLAAAGKVNIEDRMAILPDQSQADPREHEMSLRILRHLATSVQHHKYHDLDVVTLRVEAPAATDMAA